MSDESATDNANAPLAGVRVLDFSLLLPGPFCTQMLADLGADVIKVEPPTGDGTRQFPAGMYPVLNRNKRSIVLDLKAPDALAALEFRFALLGKGKNGFVLVLGVLRQGLHRGCHFERGRQADLLRIAQQALGQAQ